MFKLIAAIKKAISSKQTLDNREGRFLTVYLGNGQRRNGKVLKAGYYKTTVQLAAGGSVKVKNRDIVLVSADHKLTLV